MRTSGENYTISAVLARDVRLGGNGCEVAVSRLLSDCQTAVRRALEALADEGYAEAEFDQIGEMEGQPDEEPHASAWQGATEGEVAIVTFTETD